MSSRGDDDQRQSNWPRSSTQDRPASAAQWTDNANGNRATPSCTLEVAQRRPDQSRLNNTTRWQPWNSAQGCSRRLGSAGRSSSDRSLRSSPRSRAAIGGGLLELVHCWKRASKRLGTKRLGPDKGWVRPTLGTRCSLFIREHIEQAAAQQLASDISHKSIGQRACIPLRPVPLRPTLYGIPSSAPPRQ